MDFDETAKATMDRPSILDEAARIRRDAIEWTVYETSNFITADECAALRAYDVSFKAGEVTARARDAAAPLVRGLLSLLRNITKPSALRYFITMVDDLLSSDDDKMWISTFVQCGRQRDAPVWSCFFKLLTRTEQDEYLSHQASRCLARLVNTSDPAIPKAQFKQYCAWMLGVLDEKKEDTTLLVLNSLMRLLRRDEYRAPFAGDGVARLRTVFTADNMTLQAKYQAGFCLWMISFSPELATHIDAGVISDVAQALRTIIKEKVVRVCFAFFRNLLEKTADSTIAHRHATVMISNKVFKMVTDYNNSKKDADEELLVDAAFLEAKLKDTYEHMSSFDEYDSEIRSGNLEWSPVHRSERFWRENVMRLNEDNHALLRILIELLSQSLDPLVLAVAAHDVGEYVRHYPKGKRNIDALDGKKIIMRHMTSEHASVRYEALLCVQKMMTQNWEYLSAKTKAPSGGSS